MIYFPLSLLSDPENWGKQHSDPFTPVHNTLPWLPWFLPPARTYLIGPCFLSKSSSPHTLHSYCGPQTYSLGPKAGKKPISSLGQMPSGSGAAVNRPRSHHPSEQSTRVHSQGATGDQSCGKAERAWWGRKGPAQPLVQRSSPPPSDLPGCPLYLNFPRWHLSLPDTLSGTQ